MSCNCDRIVSGWGSWESIDVEKVWLKFLFWLFFSVLLFEVWNLLWIISGIVWLKWWFVILELLIEILIVLGLLEGLVGFSLIIIWFWIVVGEGLVIGFVVIEGSIEFKVLLEREMSNVWMRYGSIR